MPFHLFFCLLHSLCLTFHSFVFLSFVFWASLIFLFCLSCSSLLSVSFLLSRVFLTLWMCGKGRSVFSSVVACPLLSHRWHFPRLPSLSFFAFCLFFFLARVFPILWMCSKRVATSLRTRCCTTPEPMGSLMWLFTLSRSVQNEEENMKNAREEWDECAQRSKAIRERSNQRDRMKELGFILQSISFSPSPAVSCARVFLFGVWQTSWWDAVNEFDLRAVDLLLRHGLDINTREKKAAREDDHDHHHRQHADSKDCDDEPIQHKKRRKLKDNHSSSASSSLFSLASSGTRRKGRKGGRSKGGGDGGQSCRGIRWNSSLQSK